MLPEFAIWLVPEKRAYEWLAGLIAEVSQAVGATSFAPHLTLCSGTWQSEAHLIAVLQEALRGVRPLTLSVAEVDVSSEYFQSLFLRLVEGSNSALLALHYYLRQELEPRSTAIYEPHLSLVYYQASRIEKELLRAHLPTLPATLRFDEVWLVAPTGERGWQDITGWKTLYTHPLQ